MSRAGKTRASALLSRQRSAVRRLKRDLFGSDGSLRHPYFRDLRREISEPFRRISAERLVDGCVAADVIYIGDFHADPACQRFAADLLTAIASRRQVILGVELVYTRQQDILDRRQDGSIDDASFLRRIHYREEWGYPWDGFRDLLDRARALDVPVVALDRPPRGGFDGLRRRDRHAAQGIAAILSEHPGRAVVVLFGESHVARNHMPREVERLLGSKVQKCRAVTVFQDPEPVYWSALSRSQVVPQAVRFQGGSFAILHTPPLARYESYRQLLERWRGETPPDEDVDLAPAVHHLIDTLVGWMAIRPDRHRVRHRAGWVDDLRDAYPEVYSGPDAREFLGPILAEHGRSPAEIRDARRRLIARDALYDSKSNTFFLVRYDPGAAAGEAARFLRIALSGRLHRDAERAGIDAAERTYGTAYNEALVYLGARLVDPASDLVARSGIVPTEERRARRAWMEAHRLFEASGAPDPPSTLLAPLRGSSETRRALARDLGRKLGRILYERVIRGRISPRGLRALFTKDLDPPRARREVVRLLRVARR